MGRKRRQASPEEIQKLNTALSFFHDMMESGKTIPPDLMKKEIKKQINEIHGHAIYASKKTHVVNGKEVPLSWYTVHPENCHRKLTAPTEDALYKKLADYYTGKGAVLSGSHEESPDSLRSVFSRYIKDAPELSPRSVEERQRTWDLYLDDKDIAGKDICSITPSDLMRTYREIAAHGMVKTGQPFSAKYFAQITACVHAVYRYALAFEGLPITDVPKSLDYSLLSFRPTEQRTDDILARALTPGQLQKAFSWCRGNSGDLTVLAIWLDFYLGLRFAELYALRWCDVDAKHKLVHITGQMDKKGHTRQPHTKKGTAEGLRTIPLTDDASEIFRKILAEKPAGAPADSLIFPEGGYQTYRRRCRKCFLYALGTDALPKHFVTHSVRSTAASIWYASGIPVKTIQRLTGHTNTYMTLRYCHDMTGTDELRSAMAASMAR